MYVTAMMSPFLEITLINGNNEIYFYITHKIVSYVRFSSFPRFRSCCWVTVIGFNVHVSLLGNILMHETITPASQPQIIDVSDVTSFGTFCALFCQLIDLNLLEPR